MVRPLALGDLTWYRMGLLILKWRERGHTSCLNYWVSPQRGWWQELVRSGSRHRGQVEIWTLRIRLLMGRTQPSKPFTSSTITVFKCSPLSKHKIASKCVSRESKSLPWCWILAPKPATSKAWPGCVFGDWVFSRVTGPKKSSLSHSLQSLCSPLTGNCHIEKSTVTESQLVRQSLKWGTVSPKMICWKSQAWVPLKVTFLENRVFTDVIKSRWVCTRFRETLMQ